MIDTHLDQHHKNNKVTNASDIRHYCDAVLTIISLSVLKALMWTDDIMRLTQFVPQRSSVRVQWHRNSCVSTAGLFG